ncbi:hypothetical protein Fmac_030326 [Flemingia macrophylla]|uniref:Uncharacterized protein n=1 Tax=Flemingia macrophylla TaxID=520843 RepID=A0ABD1LCV3_9FABA
MQSPRSSNSPESYDGSPMRQVSMAPFMSSPAASVSPPESPPLSPSMSEMVASLRNLQLGKVKSMPLKRNVSIGMGSPCFGSSPRGSVLRPGFCSLPSTPTQQPVRSGVSYLDLWEKRCEEEPVMERVESGRGIRAKMFEKLSKENSLDGSGSGQGTGAPDVGWVSELVK